ncbi:YeaC family protein [Microbulbifer sp. SA54]|uniref:YeaC family protein n=1 Tax=Microbulbifer sp. SA54 TaxID=3401577 RepID=UPI003AAEB4D2
MFQSLEDLLKLLNPQVVGSLKRAIELGKWPNGVSLTDEQKALCGEAVAHWEMRHTDPQSRVGYVPPKSTPCADKEEQKVTWVDS